MSADDMTTKIVERDEIISLLTQDSYYRKLGHWPLLTSKDIVTQEIIIVKTPFFSVANSEDGAVKINDIFTTFRVVFEDEYLHTTELLQKFTGHVVACGGAVFRSLLGDTLRIGRGTSDVDLFFYDLTVEEANEMRMEIIEFLGSKWKNITVMRNEFTTTIYARKGDQKYIYQLIHRIYPDISAILGGFDLSASMIAYDGEELYATPLGTWSIKNQAIIVDMSRRSTSFETRLCKYYDIGFTIIFPGLLQETVDQLVINPYRKSLQTEELRDKIDQLASEYNMSVINLEFTKNSTHNIFNDYQKAENILPYLNINDGCNYLRDYNGIDYDESYGKYVKIGILPYRKDEERFINKISDYAHSIDNRFNGRTNATRMRLGNLATVVSVIQNQQVDRKLLIEECNNPRLLFNEDEIEDYRRRAKLWKKHHHNDKYISERYFGKNNIKTMIEIMKKNYETCYKNLIGIRWITKNPGRQWTASINPIMEDPRQWYGHHYLPVVTGIPSDVETTLRLIYKYNLSFLPKEIFDHILLCVAKRYADDAWNYVLS